MGRDWRKHGGVCAASKMGNWCDPAGGRQTRKSQIQSKQQQQRLCDRTDCTLKQHYPLSYCDFLIDLEFQSNFKYRTNLARVNTIWPTYVAGKADKELTMTASACHIGGLNCVNPGQFLLVYGTFAIQCQIKVYVPPHPQNPWLSEVPAKWSDRDGKIAEQQRPLTIWRISSRTFSTGG